nr:hypothetical protein GCM10020092_057880 [Actinoplanes digitatis]
MPPFLPGLRLCRYLYQEAVRPLLDEAYPGLPHAAARVGPGSEVLGFDSARSVDHDWGAAAGAVPDRRRRGPARRSAVGAARRPAAEAGARLADTLRAPGARVRVMTATTGPVAHRVEITDVASWSAGLLGFDARGGVTAADWLATPRSGWPRSPAARSSTTTPAS